MERTSQSIIQCSESERVIKRRERVRAWEDDERARESIDLIDNSISSEIEIEREREDDERERERERTHNALSVLYHWYIIHHTVHADPRINHPPFQSYRKKKSSGHGVNHDGREIDTQRNNRKIQLLYKEYLFLEHQAVLAIAYISHSHTIVARERERKRENNQWVMGDDIHSGYNTTSPSEESSERVGVLLSIFLI